MTHRSGTNTPWGVRSRGGITLGPCDSWVDDDEIHESFEAEMHRREATQRKRVPLAEVVRSELAKSAERFRRKGKR